MIKRFTATLLVAFVLLAGLSRVSAQQSDSEYFPRYGHWVNGEFLLLYHSVDDPARIFGDPITGVFADPIRPGFQMQYFERARMDFDPTRAIGHRVSLANLGEFVYGENQAGDPPGFSNASNMCRQFENGFYVCFAFLQFYDGSQGPVYFGQPISDAKYLEGRMVQYFERARMEWRAEMPVGQRVVLTELGQIDFDRRVGDPSLRIAEKSNAITLIQPKTYVFTARPLIADGQQQKLFILVTDQYNHPIPGVQVLVRLEFPDKHVENRRLNGQTDADGLIHDQFRIQGVRPNEVVKVTVEGYLSADLKGTASTWFRVWW